MLPCNYRQQEKNRWQIRRSKATKKTRHEIQSNQSSNIMQQTQQNLTSNYNQQHSCIDILILQVVHHFQPFQFYKHTNRSFIFRRVLKLHIDVSRIKNNNKVTKHNKLVNCHWTKIYFYSAKIRNRNFIKLFQSLHCSFMNSKVSRQTVYF